MARNIFIFSNIVVYFLTIVSKNTFGASFVLKNENTFTEISGQNNNDTIFHEDFENGTLIGWKNAVDWEVSATDKIAGKFSLKHLLTATNSSSSTFHAMNSNLNGFDMDWSFKLKNGKWDPSSSNKFWFYLIADTIEPNLINGFAVGVNISGSDDLLSLWRIKKGKADSLIVKSDLDWNSSTLAMIDVNRTTKGIWSLKYEQSDSTKSETYTGIDPSIFNFKNIGVNFNYTSTRAGQLWCDDLFVIQKPSELFIQKLDLINSHLLTLTFNQPIHSKSIITDNFKLTDENNQEVQINGVSLTSGSDKSIDISFGKTEGTELNLSISGILDLAENSMNSVTLTFSYSFIPEVGTVLINEILFNPFSGGVDFVELVNVSEQTIPVQRLKLASRNDTLALKQIYALTTKPRYLKPGNFLVCTKDSSVLTAQYFTNNPESFCIMKTLPSFSDDAGTVVLLNDSLEILDEFSYSAKMHSPFLADENGASLERISLKKPTNDRANWTSAAASVGFATPGLTNSQAQSEIEFQDEITPEPKAFSPNGDGYNDELAINYKLSKPGYMANVRIFDVAGRQVKFLVKNQSQAQEGSWLWDGKSESGQKLNIGVYIILVEVFDQEGQVKRFKEVCTITDRLE